MSFHGFGTFCYPKTMKFRDLQGFLMDVFEFIGQFFFRNDGFKLQEDLFKLGIRVFFENGLGGFKAFLILQT
jgi:hypothetical protein